MRTFADNAGLNTLENLGHKSFWTEVVARDDILHFATGTSGSNNGTADEDVCTSLYQSSAVAGQMAGMDVNGVLYITETDFTTKLGVSSANGSRVRVATSPGMYNSMHGSFDYAGQFFWCEWTSWATQPNLMYATLSGTTLTRHTLASNIAIGNMINSHPIIRRVESVCKTSAGILICVGSYDFSMQLGTLQFYLYGSTNYAGVLPLEQNIQFPLTETFGNWWDVNQAGSFTHAIDDPNDARCLIVVSNDGSRALTWRIRNALESEPTPLIPLDLDIGGELPQHTFLPTGLTILAGEVVCSGQFVRPFTDGSRVTLNMYSTSTDGRHWSCGELSSFITNIFSYQVLPTFYSGYTARTVIWSLGAHKSFAAPGRYIDGNGTETNLFTVVKEGEVQFATNTADQLALVFLQNPAGLKSGHLIRLSLGLYNSSLVKKGGEYGRYIVTQVPSQETQTGVVENQWVCLDEASWRLTNWSSPTDMDRWSSTQIPDPISTITSMETSLIHKSPVRDITFAASGASQVALNDPYVGYTSTKDDRDGMSSVLARFTCADPYCAPFVGLIFGGDEAGFNAFMIPRPSDWQGTVEQPFVAKSNLNAGDWEFPEREQGIFKTISSDAFARLMIHPNATASSGDAGNSFYASDATTFITDNDDYRFTLRTQGRRAQLYARKIRRGYDLFSQFAETHLLAEFRYDFRQKQHWASRSYWGVIAGTDVAGDREWWRQAQYGDLSQRITTVGNAYHDLSKLNGTAVFGAGGSNGAMTSVVLPIDIKSGQYIYVVNVSPPGGPGGLFRANIDASTGVNFTLLNAGGFCPPSGGYNVQMYVESDSSPYFTWADSGSKSELITDVGGDHYEINDPMAVRRNELSYGRMLIASDDNTAASDRYGATDGAFFQILSAGPNNNGWDTLTNPMDDTQIGNSGSDPAEWRVLMAPGMFFEGDPGDHDLPDTNLLFSVEDEIVLARKESFTLPGYINQFTGVFIPTFYRPLAALGIGSTILKGWRTSGSPGDEFDVIKSNLAADSIPIAGMLVEINSRTVSAKEEGLQYYAIDGYTSGGDDYLSMDRAFPSALVDLGAIAYVSGRGHLGTFKKTHPADSAAVYYPTNVGQTAPTVDYIRLNDFKACIGLHNSAEDDIKAIAAMAGVRKTTFGSKYSASALAPSNVNTTILPTETNFVMDIQAYIPNDGSTLRIMFRDVYYLHIQANNSLSGETGVVRLKLEMPGSGIDAYSGTKWLDWVDIPVSQFFPFGALDGGGGRINDTASKPNIRIIVNKNIVRVEMEGIFLWRFDLREYDYTDSLGNLISNYSQQTGTIAVKYSTAQAHTMSVRVLELQEEIENHIVDIASSGDSAIGFVTQERHILTRSTQDGGVQFSRYLTRPSIATVSENMTALGSTDSSLEPTGHIQVSGAEFGEYIDATWIQANGYRFGSGSNRLLNTVSDSVDEARLLQRLSKENSKQYALNFSGIRHIWQPEDGITNDGVELAISAGAIQFGATYRNSSYNARLNYA